MSKPVRLLVITHNFPRYEGDYAGLFVDLLCRRLLDHNIEPVILAPHDPNAAEKEERDGLKIYRFRYAERDEEEDLAYKGQMHKLVLGSVSGIFKFKRFLDCFRADAARLIETENIDIIAGHWLVPAGLVMKGLGGGKPLPMIISSHGTDIRLMRKYFKALYRHLRKFCHSLNRWTVVSNYLREEMIRLDSTLEPLMEVLPVPHDETLFFNDETVTTEDGLLVAVTRFTEQKRVDQLVRAISLLSERNIDCRLEIYGEGPLRFDIEGLIAKLDLGNRVLIHSPVPQEKLRQVYNRASVVVLNSVEEGFGLALSEAQLCGTAVVGADSGGITDIIEHDKTGLLVPPDNVEALASALQTILSDIERRSRLAEAGHERAVRKFSSSALAERYAKIVKQAAEA